MSPRLRLDVAARVDWQDPALWKAVAWSLPLSTLVAGVVVRFTVETAGAWAFAIGVGSFLATLFISGMLAMAMAHGSARGASAFLLPSGGGSPSPSDFSYEKSLVARGRVDEAIAALEVHLAERPNDAALCLLLADVYARNGGDPAAAERLFRRVRQMSSAARADDYRATSRLIDLYLGPLNDRAKARAELEWMCTRHAGTEGARHAQTALGRLRG